MRFQFCGDLDCPDWVLAGINLLSRMSSLKLRTLCTTVMSNLLGEELDMAKVQRATADAKLGDWEVRACVSVVGFVLDSAARHRVPASTLGQELQQLGLPREHASSLGRVLEQRSAQLADRQKRRTLRQPGFGRLQWDLLLMTGSGEPLHRSPSIRLVLHQTDEADEADQADEPDQADQEDQAGSRLPRRVRGPPRHLLFSLQDAIVCRNELRLARKRMADVS